MTVRTDSRRPAALAAFLLTAALPAGAAAQDPAPRADLDRLAAAVDAAHRPDTKAPPLVALRAALNVEHVAADADKRGQAELKVTWLDWKEPDRERSRPLLHVLTEETSKPLRQGRDRNGFWMQSGTAKAEDLQGRDFAQDLAAVRRYLKLCAQLAKLADPGAVLRSLQNPGAVASEELKLGRMAGIPCQTVTGGLATFPLLHEADGEARPVHVKAFVAADTSRLVAVEVWPVDGEGRKVASAGELVLLEQHQLDDGLLLPRKLTHFRADAEGRRRVQTRIHLTSIQLNPALRAEDLDRPQ